jgi:hypothetical protein
MMLSTAVVETGRGRSMLSATVVEAGRQLTATDDHMCRMQRTLLVVSWCFANVWMLLFLIWAVVVVAACRKQGRPKMCAVHCLPARRTPA